MTDKAKNEYQHNDDGTTHIFIESKSKRFPGKHTIIIDTEDWDKVKVHRWYIGAGNKERYPYAKASIPHPDAGWYKNPSGGRQRRRTTLPLHHAILGKPPKGNVIDHYNHNGLDNRKDNLRTVTHQQNTLNRRSSRNTSSKYKGVCWSKGENKWRAHIRFNKKSIHLGYFTCEKEAALAYNKKALELWGDKHTHLNKVEDD